MKILLLNIIFSCCVFTVQTASSQTLQAKQWDYRFGGTLIDELTCFIQTTDGGYILGGTSQSPISGDKTQGIVGLKDYWVVKIDSNGIKQWDKTFGGTDMDALVSLVQTADGGYVLGGHSLSPAGGDKTQNTQGNWDYWIVKIDSIGNKQWDKDFGGSDVDDFSKIINTSDGGCLLGGTSKSQAGGDKTQPSWGMEDYWILKIDSLGNKLWDKDLGSTHMDIFCSLIETPDRGFVLGGYSIAGVGGDKTQPSWGGWDYWILKIDSVGNKQWDKDFGGTSGDALLSMRNCSDKGYILCGHSFSTIGGDKTQDTIGMRDYWLVKIDSLGNKEWDKVYGGIDDEYGLVNLENTLDNGFLVSGLSKSPISGNKTENNLGPNQTWAVKTDSTGNLQWEKTIFINGIVLNGFAIQSREGCYVIAEGNIGSVAGYKSQPNWGSYDYWIVKFCDSLLFPAAGVTSVSSICPGTCIDFVNISLNAIAYQWNFFGATPDTSTAINPTNICYTNPGSYDVQLIATNANGSDTLLLPGYIAVLPPPPPQGIQQNGDTLFANQGAASYQWYYNGNVIPGATDYFYVAAASGDFNLIATDSNGCEVEAVINNVQAHLPFAIGFWPLAVYPNPVISTFDIQGLENNSADEIKIFNIYGERVFSAADWKLGTVNCQLFPAGLYYLEVITGKKIYKTKFIKQ